jgi:hypothetical protein
LIEVFVEVNSKHYLTPYSLRALKSKSAPFFFFSTEGDMPPNTNIHQLSQEDFNENILNYNTTPR